MFASFQSSHKGRHGLASTLFCGIVAIGLGFAAPAARAAGGDEGGGTGANAGGGASGASGVEKKLNHGVSKIDLTTCAPGQVWDTEEAQVLGEAQRSPARFRPGLSMLSRWPRHSVFRRRSTYSTCSRIRIPPALSTIAAMRHASLGGRTKGSATICSPSLWTRTIRRCASISARPMSSRASSTWRRINCR